MENPTFEVNLELLGNYKFKVDFGSFGEMMTDEPEPLGSGEGPNPSRLLAAATANCLAASLMFAIRKYKGDPGKVTATVKGHLERVEGRWRVTSMDVELRLGNSAVNIEKLDRVLAQFEDFCVVTQSVRSGIEVNVRVRDQDGTGLALPQA